MNTNIYEEIKNNGYMVHENYEPIWDKYIRKNILQHADNITKAVKLAKSYEDLHSIFSGGGITHTYSMYIRRVLRPNNYMKAVLQFLADIPATSPKYIIELYYDEIKNFNKARLYETINILNHIELIKPHILEYVTPKPVTVWIAPFAVALDINRAIFYYKADKIKYEQKEKKKEIIIKHKYEKAAVLPKPGKTLCKKHNVNQCKECR